MEDTESQKLSDRAILVQLRIDVAVIKEKLDTLPVRVGALERWKAWAMGIAMGSGGLAGYEVSKWLGVIVLAFLMGCGTLGALGPADLTSMEQKCIDAAQLGWVESGHAECQTLKTIGVQYAWAPCGNRNTADCVQMRGRRQTIMVREGQDLIDQQGGPVVHGAMHACEGSGGADHSNPTVWIASGGDTSAQARARDHLYQAR